MIHWQQVQGARRLRDVQSLWLGAGVVDKVLRVDPELDYFSDSQVTQWAHEAAAMPVASQPLRAAAKFRSRIDSISDIILRTYRASLQQDSGADLSPPAAEWLLDNYLLIKESVEQVRRDLPRKFYRELPAQAGTAIDGDGDLEIAPRVLNLTRGYAQHSHFIVTRERLTATVEGYQEVSALRIGELWAIPAMLRFVLIEQLARLAYQIDRVRRMREQANRLANVILATDDPAADRKAMADFDAYADDDAFASQLLYRISGAGDSINQVIVWLEERLLARDSDTEEVRFTEQRRQAARTVLMGNVVRSLRLLDDIDWSKWVVEVSRVDDILTKGSNFGALDLTSRSQYRRAIENLSRWSDVEEQVIARIALELRDKGTATGMSVPDIGSYLIGPDRARLAQEIGAVLPLRVRVGRVFEGKGLALIGSCVAMLTAVIAVAAYAMLVSHAALPVVAITLVLLALLPASEAAVGLFNTIATALKAPSRLVGFAYDEGVPPAQRTLVAIPCLIGSRDTIDDLVRTLEVHYLSNPKGDISFALVSDWPDSPVEQGVQDDELLAYAQAAIDTLSAKYAFDGRNRFFLLHRRRLYNETEGIWMGWERKRGKLSELNALLRGDLDVTFVQQGPDLPQDIQYVMTLDSDTRLTRGAVAMLVGKMAHPLNHPKVDEETGRVTKGYAIMQPRVVPSLTTGSEASAFQRIFSINRGFDPYVFSVSDTYQDLTGEGSFTGKGLYHVDSFHAVLDSRIPENAVLSHDLLEGNYARCALVTDVEFVEDYPIHYHEEAARQHRWTRGDWQLLPFIFGRHRGVTALNRYKMLDNLRRSLISPSWVAASVLGWIALAPGMAVIWQLFLMFSLFLAPTLALIRETVTTQTNATMRAHGYAALQSLMANTAQVILRTVFIAHSAALMCDAILRTLYRLCISRRHLLEWRPYGAASAEAGARGYWSSMRWSIALALTALALTIWWGGVWQLALPFCAVWTLAPVAAWWFSRTAETEDRLTVTPEDTQVLRRVGRRTWQYFDTFVTAEHNWLPPDNFQEIPLPVVASRTSPSNIGLYLLSVVAARDFGWIGLRNTLSRLESTIDTVTRLEKHEGHLYNWYDTRRAVPLMPRYVSTVDSGNLAGHLIAVSAACRNWASDPLLLEGDRLSGLIDICGILGEELDAIPNDRRALRPLRHTFQARLGDFQRAAADLQAEPAHMNVRIISLTVIARNIQSLAQSLADEIGTPQADRLPKWANALGLTCEMHVDDATMSLEGVRSLRQQLASLSEKCRDIAFSMDFRFLYNRNRSLLSIGFQATDRRLDDSCYDLLASEARLASFFAIAKGDVPTEHWFRLGRRVVPVRALGALLSWSGSMFEYLMPTLVMQEEQGGILNQSNRLSIRRQIDFARVRGIPWGVSESAFNARDKEMTYQYMVFGVPSLGMKRGLADDLVIAPYATLLASQYVPGASVRNLDRLAEIGALGEYGYYDAVDFTKGRLPEGKKHVVVRNFMAHHHGMSIVAVANVTHQGRMRERFHSDPVIEAAELLLQEKAPRTVPLPPERLETEPKKGLSEHGSPDHKVIEGPALAEQAVAILSNGHYSSILSARGGGQGMWNGQAVTRWDRDPSGCGNGPYLFLRDAETGEAWSATPCPLATEDDTARVVFSDSKVEYHRTCSGLHSEVEVIVANDHDAEGRRVVLTNPGTRDRRIEVTSYVEPVVGDAAADSAHPTFSRMFLRTRISDDNRVIRVERNPRTGREPDMKVAHIRVDSGHSLGPAEAETERRRFIGRGRTLANPRALDPKGSLSGTDGFTLDPVLALRQTILVPAGGTASLIFWTIAAPTDAELDQCIAHLSHEQHFLHETMQAWTRSQIQLRDMGTSLTEAATFQRFARYIIFPDKTLKTGIESSDVFAQSALWSMGISGDDPIFVLRIDDDDDIAIVRKAVRMQEYFRARGVAFDLVIMNERDASYVQDLQNAIRAICESARLRSHLAGQHIFDLRRDQVGEASHRALMALARIVLHARNGSFTTQLDRAEDIEAIGTGEDGERREEEGAPVRWRRRTGSSTGLSVPAAIPAPSGSDLRFWNGFGGFAPEGGDYIVRLRTGEATPQPWINVIANSVDFGFHVSAEGAGFTWSINSRDHQLTPWSNDPVSNRPGEAIFVVDRDNGDVTSPFAAFAQNPTATFETRHGAGMSTFNARDGGLNLRARQIVGGDDPVKLTRLRINNIQDRPRRLRVYGYAEWVLGTNRAATAPHIRCDMNADDSVLMATNGFSADFADRTTFFACDTELSSFTTRRSDFIGGGSALRPACVQTGQALPDNAEGAGDPCAAICLDIDLGPGEMRDLTFMLGDAASRAEASEIVARHRSADFEQAVAATKRSWDKVFDTLQVDTPDAAMNLMINRWLPYQTLACRLRARTGFYQASGAFGFRDQLQDTLALMLQDPGLARAQILNAASRQFAEGDVQHWWLPRSGAGVRTTISDDVVWLSYGVSQYISCTGDHGILDEPVPFLKGPELEEGQHDAFFAPEVATEEQPLYEHCAVALDLAISRTGTHGLSLIMGGDWNDGMNRVGEEGRGESVWLSWFLAHALDVMTPLAEARGDTARVNRWSAHLKSLLVAVESEGWDGSYYRRGYYDDGTPLGSSESEECRIDSIAQTWSVIAGLGDADRRIEALDQVMAQLVDREANVVKLFTPPFAETPQEPGYIKGYPPGVRENGGQYTHAATWVVYALAMLGRGDDAKLCFDMINPINHALNKEAAQRYRVEPYVVAADIYGEGDKAGRGGWTWYTGSGGWLYRAGVEAILGIRKRGDRLFVAPNVPSDWDGYSAVLKLDGSAYRIKVERGVVTVNGERVDESAGYILKARP